MREFEGRLRVCPHAQSERFQSLEDHPRVERGQGRSTAAQEAVQAFENYIPAAEHRATEHPTLAIEIFGRGMDDNVGAQIERPLQDRCAETIVDHEQRTRFVRYLREFGDV